MVTGAFTMVVALRYFRYRERIAMIEKGLDLRPIEKNWMEPKPYNGPFALQFGLVGIEIGIGLLLAYIITNSAIFKGDDTPVYLPSSLYWGGLGLVIAFLAGRKMAKKHAAGV
jgi:hypothetical protein